MTTPARASRRMLMLVLVASSAARAQALSSASSATLSLAAPTEAEYDAGASNPTSGYTITTSCTGTGSAGCRLFIQHGSNPQGQQAGMQWALSSATAPCEGIPALNVFADVVPAAVVLTTRKNQTCVATFAFRVNPLAYATYTSPGPVSGAYKQELILVLTRP